jgi:rfaE bifunctional protein nucleotidyltransferase chain/domain
VSECHSEPRRGQGPAGRSESAALIEKVRARGGRVIATGGCFDLLHAGHVAMLQTARSCGDCLVVCLNSDASVRRLKGATRPIQDEQSRRRVLDALECVDAVELFDEDTPERVIRELRPDVWVKGGDYAGTVLAESSVMQEWGGEAITVPYVSGLSTTGLVARARQNDQF